jgi:hypothetical protein
MNREELEAWLCGPDACVPTPTEIAALVGISFASVADTTLLRVADRLRGVRFTLAVLRDVFTDDRDVRAWFRAPRPELGARCALDLLLAGRPHAVEALAVREWHRPPPAAAGQLPRVLTVEPTRPYAW